MGLLLKPNKRRRPKHSKQGVPGSDPASVGSFFAIHSRKFKNGVREKIVDNAIFREYLALIEQAYKAGNATEHTHRPALKTLLEAFQSGIIATNEPKRIKCGAPDYIITRKDIPLGFVEAKDIGEPLDKWEKDDQLLRYRDGLANLILTDYLEFRWYVSGELRLTARLAKPQASGKLRIDAEGVQQLAELLQSFFAENIPVISSPKELATRMAALARLIRTIIGKTFAEEGEHGTLHEQMDGFRKVLLHDLTAEQFGDMYAQTICYGLFAARCNSTGAHFTRTHAAYDLPKTNPFLRKLFTHIAGPELDERIVWVVDNLAELLNRADIAAILQDFGRATRQEDPVVHFYETFLGAYDQKMREARGVYYTPEPVVSYIVRSVDAILKKDFKLSAGLADSSKVKLTRPKQRGKGMETIETHKVQILDPATGTGTFLYSVIRQIYQTFAGNKGMWPGYVRENLLPRVYGFELLMAPYAVAHMKLGLLLRETGYDFSSDERLRVFLTNTLEEAHEMTGLPLFTQWLADEATSANLVKKETPVMVVLGNPPYSGHSANTGEWIAGLLRGIDSTTGQKTGNYFEVDGAPLGERNPKWLNDDYVKFIRFAQWRIEQTGYGVLAFVTNHGYLDNPTFRGMRQSLMQSFDDIYLLDLHGNSKKKEKAPDGSKDENVFDIQQGVAIGIFVKHKAAVIPAKAGIQSSTKPLDSRLRGSDENALNAQVYHADIYGTRESKYAGLAENDVSTTRWQILKPQAPYYLFVTQDETVRAEYEQGWKITDIMPVNSVGIVTARDALSIHWSREDIWRTVNDFSQLPVEEAREKYALGKDARDWQVALAQSDLRASGPTKTKLAPVLYRPFDVRHTYYTGNSRGFHCMPRGEVMRQMLAGKNLGLATTRSIEIERGWEHLFCTNGLITHHTVSIKEVNYLFPLYLYSAAKADLFDDSTAGGRRPNLAPEFIADFSARLQLDFVLDGCGDLRKTYGPEDVYHYIYAVFHSPIYRSRYAEFLKGDFPRLPLTRDVTLFRSLCALGEELVALHLMEQLPKLETSYPVAGDNMVDNVRYSEPANDVPGHVWINQKQYFDNVPPEVWGYHIGGYQVCHKWLKDRKGRQLSYDDLTHYRSIVSALARTIELQAAIDDAIGEWPLQ
jgi:hypothetical protein